jgi:hypothetical protein
MISYQFFILHGARKMEYSFEAHFIPLTKNDSDIWIDNNLGDTFPSLLIESNDETASLIRRIIFKSSGQQEGFPEIYEASEEMKMLLTYIRNGMFSSYPEVKDQESLQLSFIRLETEESRDRKIFISIVEKILIELNGIIIHPEIMRLNEFRSFFSLVSDVVEEEKEPEEEN